MAIVPVRLGALDFDDIKASLKNYLSKQTEFTDMNFEGSGISQLLNVLAYNAHYDALAANYLANEMFLDTAVKRSSVVSRAKELGYVPRSRRASNLTLSIKLKNVINESTISSLIVPKGTRFSTTVNDESFVFTTIETVSLLKVIESGAPVFTGTLQLYEGVLTQQTVTYNSTSNIIPIPNVDIDTSTLKVEVYENLAWTPFYLPAYYIDINSSTSAYLLQEGFKGFEVYFGAGALGRSPVDGSSIRMTYMTTSGSSANGAKRFQLLSNIPGMLSNTLVTLSSIASSDGGQENESMESIKLNAKNAFGSQNRAVTPSDYSSLTIQNFTNVKDVIAWDGSDNIPPRFGRVILCIQPIVGDVTSSVEKAAIAAFLQKKSVGNVKVEFYDPEYINIEVYSTVKYDVNTIKIGTYELGYIVQSVISSYANSTQKFGGTFRYSTLVGKIDASNYAIEGNETTLRVNRECIVVFYTPNTFKFSFMNSILPSSIKSTEFYDGISGGALFLKDLKGILHAYYSLNGADVLYQTNIGTINYLTGDVAITNLQMTGLNGIKFLISAETEEFDLYSSKNVILKLDQANMVVKVIKDKA